MTVTPTNPAFDRAEVGTGDNCNKKDCGGTFASVDIQTAKTLNAFLTNLFQTKDPIADMVAPEPVVTPEVTIPPEPMAAAEPVVAVEPMAPPEPVVAAAPPVAPQAPVAPPAAPAPPATRAVKPYFAILSPLVYSAYVCPDLNPNPSRLLRNTGNTEANTSGSTTRVDFITPLLPSRRVL